jgi:hypothetical protein
MKDRAFLNEQLGNLSSCFIDTRSASSSRRPSLGKKFTALAAALYTKQQQHPCQNGL